MDILDEQCSVCGKTIVDYIYLGDGLALIKPCDCVVDIYSGEQRGTIAPVDSQPPTSGSDQS